MKLCARGFRDICSVSWVLLQNPIGYFLQSDAWDSKLVEIVAGFYSSLLYSMRADRHLKRYAEFALLYQKLGLVFWLFLILITFLWVLTYRPYYTTSNYYRVDQWTGNGQCGSICRNRRLVAIKI